MMTASATTAPPPKMDNKRSQACSMAAPQPQMVQPELR
jgi:hypothetical protein